MEKFKEKRIVKIMDGISSSIAIMFFLSLIISIFYHQFLIGLFLIPISIMPILVSNWLSEKDNYTKQFILYIKSKVKNAKSLTELNEILNEFESLAIENNIIQLSFPADLKIIYRDLISKIEILELQNNINGN